MDPKTQMPDIKAEVNKVDDGKKKGAGLLGLFGGGGGGAAGGLGGLGAGAAGGGGLLATKAGMLALVLIGTSVAGGIGVAGYKMFGPGEADRTGGNLSLFAPKPPQAAEASAGAASADGSSQSLSLMAQSAAKDREADPSASAAVDAPTDSTAGDAAKDPAAEEARRAAAARAAAAGAINKGGGAGAVGSMKGLANVKKLGALSGSAGGGASTTASSGPAGRLGDGLAAGSRAGATGGFSRGGGGAKASGAKGRAARGGRGARQQARNVMGDQRGGRAASSFSAGSTYDGAATQDGGAIGPDGGAIGMDGVGDGAAGEQPKTLPANSASNINESEPPIPKPKEMVTPWEKAVQRAQMLTMLALALAFAASKVKMAPPWGQVIMWVIAAAIAAIGVYIGVLAGQIMSGPYGQKTQGMIVAAASLGVLATAAAVAMGAGDTTDKANGMSGGGLAMAYLGGGVAAIAAVGIMLAPKPKPIELQEGQDRPDVRYEAKPNPVRYMV